jgi:hypothetical protein
MTAVESAHREIILERKLNDELLRACRRHAINNRHQNWVTLGAIFGCASPIVGLIYYAIEHGGVGGYPWVKAVTLFLAVILVSTLTNWLLAQQQKSASTDVRRTCVEAELLGFFIVKRSSQYRHEWYPYSYILAASKNFTPESSDDISDRLAKLQEYPDSHGLSGLLEGLDPPLPKIKS